MSDEDKDIDIESDDDEDSVSGSGGIGGGRTDLQFASQAEKRAHHNALERKRRDHIKDSFCSLRDSVPSLQGEKVRKNEKASRAQILKKAADYIEYMRRKHGSHQQDIDDLKKQNKLLESQIRALEKTKYTGNYAMSSSPGLNQTKNENLKYDGSSSDSSDSESSPQQQNKKIKT